VFESQAGGFRHRRDGLSYRLYLKDKDNEWRPNKRVKPSNEHSSKRKKIYEKRTFLSQESFRAYKMAEKQNDFNVFIKYMDPIIEDYNRTVAKSFVRRVLGKIRRELRKFLRK